MPGRVLAEMAACGGEMAGAGPVFLMCDDQNQQGPRMPRVCAGPDRRPGAIPVT